MPAVEDAGQVEEHRQRRRRSGASPSAHPSLHGSAQMENPTKAIIATLSAALFSAVEGWASHMYPT